MARPKKIPHVLTEDDFNRAIKVYYDDKPCFSRMRNCLIFSICFYIGLRPKEAKDIKINHINFTDRIVYIPAENNKQRNQDLMSIPNFLMDKIKTYLLIRNKLFDSEWLFPSNKDKNLPRGNLIRAFDIMIKISGLRYFSYVDKLGHNRRNLSIYSLRHSFGTMAMHTYKDIKIVAKALRHYDPQCRSTYIYIHTDAAKSRKEIIDGIWSYKK